MAEKWRVSGLFQNIFFRTWTITKKPPASAKSKAGGKIT